MRTEGGDFMDAAKIVLGVMTVIGLLADLLSDDDCTQKYRLTRTGTFLSLSLGYTLSKQGKVMSIRLVLLFCNIAEQRTTLLPYLVYSEVIILVQYCFRSGISSVIISQVISGSTVP